MARANNRRENDQLIRERLRDSGAVARQIGDEILLEPKNGRPMYRWILSAITPKSFHWRSIGSPDGGKTWLVNQEMIVWPASVKARMELDPMRTGG